jgi:hypothetical protein
MTLVVPNVGEDLILQYAVNKDAPEDLVLKLFKSDTTPAESDTAATFTESDWTGYSSSSLTGASWNATPGDPSQVDYAQQIFTSSADQAVQQNYGYFLVRTTGTELMWAERFTDGPYPIENDGDQIKVTPIFTGA